MSDQGAFRPIGESDQRMFGTQSMLLCGFSPSEQDDFAEFMSAAGLGHIGVMVAQDDDLMATLGELQQRPAGSGHGQFSNMTRAVILSGLTEAELHTVMRTFKHSGLGKALWAALTPTSKDWRLNRLLHELEEEHKAVNRS